MPLIPTTDGSAAKTFFEKMEPETADLLRSALAMMGKKSVELATEAAALGAMKAATILGKVSDDVQSRIGENAVQAVDENISPIVNTAMDAAVAVIVTHPVQIRKIGEISSPAAALVAGAALSAGLSAGKIRGELYHAGSVLGDAEAIASGNPGKIMRRVGQHVFWRAFGKLGPPPMLVQDSKWRRHRHTERCFWH